MARKNPVVPDIARAMPEMDKHEQMCNDISGAMSSLRDKIRKPYDNSGENLLPKDLRSGGAAGKSARKHIERIHRAIRSER